MAANPCVIKAVRRNRGQCKCLWCGRYPAAGGCPVTPEIKAALREWAIEHGRTWKSDLWAAWQNGTCPGLLQQLRNAIGPTGLDKLQTARILRFEQK